MRLSSAVTALGLITTYRRHKESVMTSAWCLRLAAVSGFLRAALGAFGAHSLKPLLQTHQTLEIWEKAVMYHALHTLVLLGLAAQPGIAWAWW